MKYFVSGTDTNIGKTVAVAWLAKKFASEGRKVVTQKLIQTGCEGISEDILAHRKITGSGLLPEDENRTTCRYVLKFPASPHLACEMEGVEIDLEQLAKDAATLECGYDVVLIEGAGGLLVPLKKDFSTADYIVKNGIGLVLVVPSRLGSLNHALLSLEYCRARGINLAGIVYNTYPTAPKEIEDSTREYIKDYISKNFPDAEFWEMNFVPEAK